jgi:hypothetical protein
VDQSQSSGTVQEPSSRNMEGRLHITLSVVVEYDRLQKLSGNKWETSRIRQIRKLSTEQFALAEAIEPLFNDIADRKKRIIGDEFICQCGARQAGQAMKLRVPRHIRWVTEGDSFAVDLGDTFAFESLSRSFWFFLSNKSVSYNLSIEIPYRHDWRDYYAMSFLQKILFPTEATEWALLERLVERTDSAQETFWDYVKASFNQDACDLFQTAGLAGRVLKWNEHKPDDYWGALLDSPAVSEDLPGLPERRALFLLEDPSFFDALGATNRAKLARFGDVLAGHFVARAERGDKDVRVIDLDLMSLVDQSKLDYYFLSGFFQNIIDFMRQDTSEVKDGTAPAYPPPEMSADDTFFILYANPTTVFEVVSSSRSLEAGRPYIGTCPYLFFVHIIAYYRETLVKRYEQEVLQLINDNMNASGMTPDGFRKMSDRELSNVVDRFSEYRLTMFHNIYIHDYFDVLRYDTERLFLKSIEDVRSIGSRRLYWDEILVNLEGTIGDIRARVQRKSEREFNALLALVTGFSVFQVAFAATDAFRKITGKQTATPLTQALKEVDWSEGVDAVSIVLSITITIILIYIMLRRVFGRSSV